jgi:hypothetical protein
MAISHRTPLRSVSSVVATDPPGCCRVRSCQTFSTPCKLWLTSRGDDRILAINRTNAIAEMRLKK